MRMKAATINTRIRRAMPVSTPVTNFCPYSSARRLCDSVVLTRSEIHSLSERSQRPSPWTTGSSRRGREMT